MDVLKPTSLPTGNEINNVLAHKSVKGTVEHFYAQGFADAQNAFMFRILECYCKGVSFDDLCREFRMKLGGLI